MVGDKEERDGADVLHEAVLGRRLESNKTGIAFHHQLVKVVSVKDRKGNDDGEVGWPD